MSEWLEFVDGAFGESGWGNSTRWGRVQRGAMSLHRGSHHVAAQSKIEAEVSKVELQQCKLVG